MKDFSAASCQSWKSRKSRDKCLSSPTRRLSVAEEAISNSFPKISSTPKILPAQNPPPLSFFQSKVPPPSYSSHPGNCRTSPQLLPEQSSIRAPPLHSGAAKAPDDVPSARKLARSSSEAGKKGPAEPPTCNYSHPHPRRQNTSIDSAPVSPPFRTCPIATSPSKNHPRAPKLTAIPIAPQTTPHATDTPHLRNARLDDADPSPTGGAVARARPARQRGASQREGQSCTPGPTPRNPSPGDDRSINSS